MAGSVLRALFAALMNAECAKLGLAQYDVEPTTTSHPVTLEFDGQCNVNWLHIIAVLEDDLPAQLTAAACMLCLCYREIQILDSTSAHPSPQCQDMSFCSNALGSGALGRVFGAVHVALEVCSFDIAPSSWILHCGPCLLLEV